MRIIIIVDCFIMVLLLPHKPLINMCLCVRGVHLSRMHDMLSLLYDESTDVSVVSVYVAVGSLYNRDALSRLYDELYPDRHIVFLDINEIDIHTPKDVAHHLSLDKYIFVEVNEQIDTCLRCFTIDKLSVLYWGLTNLTTPMFSLVNTTVTDEGNDIVAIYVYDGRIYFTTRNRELSSLVEMEVDILECESIERWYLKTATGYLGAPNKDRNIYVFPMTGPHTRFMQVVPGFFVYDNYMFDKNTFEIVVARYAESMEWARKYQDVVTVYEKHIDKSMLLDDNIVPCSRREHLPNVGRESHTYLHHIIENYDSLALNTFFTQCGIEEHTTYPIEEYLFNKGSSCFRLDNFKTIYAKDGRYGFLRHKCKWLEEYNSGKMLPEKRTFKQWWTESVKKPLPHIHRYKWSHGAIFSVSKQRILHNSIQDYKRMIKCLSDHSNPETGHYFERAWYYIFEESSKSI